MSTPRTIVTTPEEILDALRPELRGLLAEILPDVIKRATAKEYLTKPELMELTGWSSRKVEYVKAERKLPYIRRGRTVLFPAQAVYDYLDEARVPARRAA